MSFLHTHSGSKYWRSTRKIKVISQADYSAFRGKKRVKILPSVSDTDHESDDEPPFNRAGAAYIDLTSASGGSGGTSSFEANNMLKKIESLEKVVQDSVKQNEQLQKLLITKIAKLEDDNKKVTDQNQALDNQLFEFKNCFSCIVCKCSAKFPWQITPCCHILMCANCANRWLMMEASCPHCRAVIAPGTCERVESLHGIGQLLGLESDNSEEGTSQ